MSFAGYSTFVNMNVYAGFMEYRCIFALHRSYELPVTLQDLVYLFLLEVPDT